MDQESVVLKKLEEISAVLSENYKEKEHIGVLSGISGIALFQFYYAKFLGNESHADIGVEMITLVIAKINEGYSFPTFCTGISGAAWVIELLKEEEFIDIDSDDLLCDLDDYLSHSMKEMGEEDNFYDFLHGTLGIGFYFLKRYQRTESDVLKERYKGKLLEIISLLNSTSVNDNDTTAWESYLVKSEGLKGYNLSLSHGIASIINFLSRLVIEDDFNAEAAPLLRTSINYVLTGEKGDETNTSLFPSWIYDDMDTNTNERLAWCYGDLGIGLTLWRAGKALKDDFISEKGKTILKHSSKRRSLEESKIKDAGLCHGAFGIAQIYDYVHKETNEAVFKETANFWFGKGIEMAIHPDGYAGYKQWQGGEDQGWREETNLLEGIAGIGLAMISSLATFDTKWDQCLLIS